MKRKEMKTKIVLLEGQIAYLKGILEKQRPDNVYNRGYADGIDLIMKAQGMEQDTDGRYYDPDYESARPVGKYDCEGIPVRKAEPIPLGGQHVVVPDEDEVPEPLTPVLENMSALQQSEYQDGYKRGYADAWDSRPPTLGRVHGGPFANGYHDGYDSGADDRKQAQGC